MKIYDTIIIGGGPAGLSAAVYSLRYKLNTIIISPEIGGQITEAHLVENYPGFHSLSGYELMQNFKKHVEYLKGEILSKEVTRIEGNGPFTVHYNDGQIQGKTIIYTTGTKRRKLGVPGEEKLTGKGVSYCATCDGFFFKDKTVAVIGGNDSAASAAILLAQYASKIKIIYRKGKLRAEPYWTELIEKNEKIEVIYNTEIATINGESKIESLTTKKGEKIDVDGVFIEIGSDPKTDLRELELNEKGYIKVKPNQETSIKGIFAAGDITTESNGMRQVITAAAEGAIAAESVFSFLKSN